ncbi:flagellar filament capping protein FliD [Vallicoccus soli]|uniref:Flagellar hook-associated protein 2 n=1 Tax=Vallicoccus soli TaxID=2339232 RepID=A0A3A3YQ41_9ACTN|nr:flagellar filament capping protein FliD [Vallicoccus soli]RJK92823.1 flagellar hook protein [Vallicoccus soli]
MSTMSISGLVSGLDTSSLISQLMQAERAPQTALKAKVTAAQAVVTAYQTVNSKFAALQTAAEKFTKGTAWNAPTGASTSGGVTVSTSSTGTPGAVTFDVLSVASALSVVTDVEGAQDATAPGRSFTLDVTTQAADGTTSTVSKSLTSTNGSLQSVADAINEAKAGVTAVALQVAPGQYRLQVTSDKPGAGNGFALDGLGTTTQLRPAQDAVLDLGGGVVVSSPSNTFSGVLEGTSFTVSKVEPLVTVSATVEPKAIADQVQAMVDAANAALSEISKLSAYDATSKKGAALAGDSTVRGLAQSLSSRAITPVGDAGSPVGAGIQLQRDGKLTFDRDAFLKAYEADPARARALVDGVASQVVGVAKDATDKSTGRLTTAIQGRNDLVKDLNQRIDAWDTRLAARQTALQKQFTAMETALQSMQSQSSWLAGQLNSLG